MVRKQSSIERTDQDISTTGVIAETTTTGDPIVSLNIEATAAASYAIDVSADGETWFEGEVVYDQADVDDATDIRDTFQVGDARMRVRVTTAASSGETATVTIQQAH